MRVIYIAILFLLASLEVMSQTWRQGYVNMDFSMGCTMVNAPKIVQSKDAFPQMAGFPVSVAGNPSFKNFRGLALEDIDNNGITDIVFAANSTIYAYSFTGLIWQQALIGTAIYPPSTSDINNDGYPEIVQVTGGSPSNGRIYVFDKDGTVLPGWPVNFSNHWIICSPVISDLDDDNLKEIIVCERMTPAGKVHVLKLDGSEFSSNWPVTLDGTPALTPSVADVDNDGEKDIVAYSTTSRYIFGLNGLPKNGFPNVTAPLQNYSYQSPVIGDFDNNGQCEVVGSTHGDAPMFYVLNNDGSSYPGWPHGVPDVSWTYAPPSVVKINGNWNIFMSRPIGSDPDDMLYGWDASGNMLPGFPIVKSGGLEGFISIADINNDNEFELVFGSNLLDSTGRGFIHAYKTDGSGGELANFPIRPRGWTFVNGVNIGDVNGDNMMDLVALTYTNSYDSLFSDRVFVNVYELNVPYTPEKVLWGTYKGTNERTGFVGEMISNIPHNETISGKITVSPNPVVDKLKISWNNSFTGKSVVKITDITGRTIQYYEYANLPIGESTIEIDLTALQAGCYFAVVEIAGKLNSVGKIIKH
ncbi:MAG TPA: T9SS type A sorting domain-containing protein [Bacteroidales bacterium]|nr:T9SS type A sorting domain-containing protein [Bacteroidales bacterium]HPS26238.1 T9SS type A sorting domain-containing protein [Bacteroidales bacterium]